MWRVLQKRASRRATSKPDYWSFPRDIKAKPKSNDLYLARQARNDTKMDQWSAFGPTDVSYGQLSYLTCQCILRQAVHNTVCLWKFFKRIFEILCIFRLISNILHDIWPHIFTARNDAKMDQWSAFGPTTSDEPLGLNQAFSRASAYLSVRIYFWSKLLCIHRNVCQWKFLKRTFKIF